MDAKRLKGCLLGVAIGDLLGTELEIGTARASDDTMMTLCVAEGIVKSPYDPIDPIGNEFIQWYREDGFGIGKTTAYAIENAMVNNNWDYGAKKAHELSGNKSAGNGSLMRTSPIGHLYDSLKDALYFSGAVSNMTHYDIKAKEACNLYTWLIHLLKEGWGKKESLKEVIDYHIIYGKYQELEEEELLTTAYVEDTLLTSLWVFNKYDSFEEGIIKSISLGGDRDTIGAVTGGLLGTYWGEDGIPKKQVEKIEDNVRNKIDAIVEEVCKC